MCNDSRVCPGRPFAEASLFIIAASLLHAFEIGPPLDASGAPRELKKLMGRRNYVAIVAYDPDTVAGGSQYAASMINGQAGMGAQQGLSKLSLAVDFVVQGDGAFTTPTKYGPVIVPHLEFGH